MHDPARVLTAARAELARLPDVLDVLIGDLDPAQARERPAADEWAPIEILCHLRDEETEDFGARLCAVLEGRPAFSPIDPEGWVVQRSYRDAALRQVLADFRDRRAQTLHFLTSVTHERLLSSLPQPKLVSLSGLDLLVAWVAHDALHLRQLAGTLARLWTRRWAPLKAEYAGPIPYGADAPTHG